MGYRSDVVLMAVFSNAEEREEVLAIYRMDPRVGEHKLEEEWRKVDFGDGAVGLVYEGHSVKWYNGYDDVQGLQHMQGVIENFNQERDFEYAWGEARIGEEDTDIEWVLNYSDSKEDHGLQEFIYDNLQIIRRIELSV